MGLVPQSAAKAASECSRSRGGGVWAGAVLGEQRRGGVFDQPGQLAGVLGDLGGQLLVAAGQRLQCAFDASLDGSGGAGPGFGAAVDQRGWGQRGQLVAQRWRGGHQDGSQLVHRRSAGLDRRGAGAAGDAQQLDWPVAGLRDGGGVVGQHRPGGGIGVDTVGLAAENMAGGPVGVVDIDHGPPGGQQRAG